MLELFNDGQPVDLVTLQNRLKEKNVPPEVSSLEYVGNIVAAVPTSANIKYYANIVKEKALLRELIRTTEGIENAAYAQKDPVEDILADTEKSIFTLLQNQGGGDYVPIKDVVLNALEKIQLAAKTKGNVTGIPTGFIDLDYKMSGLQPSDLILVAARPSMGKTAFVLNIAQYVAFHEDECTAIFSLEMSKEQLVNPSLCLRIACGCTAAPFRKFSGLRLGETDRRSGNDRKIQVDHRRYARNFHIGASQQVQKI